MKLGASILSVVDAYYSLAVSSASPSSVMWRFPAGEPATLTVFNAGFSMASGEARLRDCVASVAFAKQPESHAELAGAAWSICTGVDPISDL
jgi:hypothetical protein